MRQQRDREAGFTLVEVLVALALLSLILGTFGTLFYRLEMTNAAITRIERSENVDVVRRYLQQRLEGARPQSILGADGTRTIHFTGEPSRVAFAGVATGDRETGGLYETEVWLDSKGRLLQQRRPLGWGRVMETEAEVLLEDLASLTFSYAACPFEAKGAGVQRWTDKSQLPSMISVTATFKEGDPRSWRQVSAFVPAAACAVGK